MEIVLRCTFYMVLVFQAFQKKGYLAKWCLANINERYQNVYYWYFFRGDIKYYCFNLNKERFVLMQQYIM